MCTEHGLIMKCVCGAKEKIQHSFQKCGKTINNADTAISDANFRHKYQTAFGKEKNPFTHAACNFFTVPCYTYFVFSTEHKRCTPSVTCRRKQPSEAKTTLSANAIANGAGGGATTGLKIASCLALQRPLKMASSYYEYSVIQCRVFFPPEACLGR